MDPHLLPFAQTTAPRYTSYPTAPHFSAAVGPAQHAEWLAALPASAQLSLYLHIPYCRDICWYCGCHTFAARRDQPVLNYAESLAAEIARVGSLSGARRAVQIHWGGGTPNILAPETFTAIASGLAEAFDLSQLDEHAVELDPRTLTEAQVQAFAAAGVTRASLGVQDLNAHVQKAIGRTQPFALVEKAVRRLRGAGVAGLNLDLMYGLPLQSLEDAARTAHLAASLGSDRLAVFGYAHVPWFKSRQKLIDAQALPDAALRLDQAEVMRETLLADGYQPIGFDHFAKPGDALARAAVEGRLRRNFQGYVCDPADALLGFGASAISTFPQGYLQNQAEVGAWARAIGEGGLASVRGIAVTPEDVTRRELIEKILCNFALDLGPYGGFTAFPDAAEPLAELAAAGIAEIGPGERLTVTDRGRPFVRLAAQAFDAWRPRGPARHSVAV